MSINFNAKVIAGSFHTDWINDLVSEVRTCKHVESTLDLGNHRANRTIKTFGEHGEAGNFSMDGADCIQWLNEIDTLQGNFAKHYIEELMHWYQSANYFVLITIYWA